MVISYKTTGSRTRTNFYSFASISDLEFVFNGTVHILYGLILNILLFQGFTLKMTTLCRTGIITRGSGFNLLSRQLHISACCQKNIRAGTQKITSDRSKQLTYEEAARPYDIGVKKTWNSWNTSEFFSCY